LDLYINSGFVKVELRSGDGIMATIPAIAHELIREGLTLCEDFRIGPERLVEYIWLERRQADLRPLPRDLYVKARLSMYEQFLRGDERAVRTFQMNLRELVQQRLRKILNAAAMNPDLVLSREFLEKLTYEEEVLVRQIASLIKDWLTYVLGLVR